MDVFSLFPAAIVSGVWELGQNAYSTEVGKRYVPIGACDVIIDEESATGYHDSYEDSESDLLLYARPEQLPSLNTAELRSDYLWKDTENDQLYEIRWVGIGKDQETGEISHVEFKLRQIGGTDEL